MDKKITKDTSELTLTTIIHRNGINQLCFRQTTDITNVLPLATVTKPVWNGLSTNWNKKDLMWVLNRK